MCTQASKNQKYLKNTHFSFKDLFKKNFYGILVLFYYISSYAQQIWVHMFQLTTIMSPFNFAK